MKIIKLTESQYRRLFEGTSVPKFDNGDLKEFPGSEISTTTVIHNVDGDKEYGKPLKTGSDKVANKLTPQGYFLNGRGHTSRTM